MKLIYLYGAPATGKLTIAQKLAEMTGYKILHNHLSNDLVEAVLDYENEDFFDIAFELRKIVMHAAVKHGVVGVITTSCYAYGNNEEERLKKYFDGLRAIGVEIDCVHLVSDKEELLKRVQGESRQKYGKLKKPEKLKEVLEKYDFYTKIPFMESLVIDNTKLEPEEVVKLILEYVNK
ncbi:AAA family ATPase [Patescibacteria group bacterium]|nr:AAA family ATPase [Patescibacteria group bacterium]